MAAAAEAGISYGTIARAPIATAGPMELGSPVIQTVTPLPSFEASHLSVPDSSSKIEFSESVESVQLILPHIPRPHERNKFYNIPVEYPHEIGHALAGKAQGLGIQFLDFNPDSDGSLARVLFTGSVDAITAAASQALAGPFGTAGDRQTVAYLKADWNTSVTGAATRINFAYPKDVQSAIIELTALVAGKNGKHIPGSLFDQIVLRAFQEVEFKDQLNSIIVGEDAIEASRVTWEAEIEASKQQLALENYIKESIFEDGTRVKEYVTNGKIIFKESICPVCGGSNGHIPSRHSDQDNMSQPIFRHAYPRVNKSGSLAENLFEQSLPPNVDITVISSDEESEELPSDLQPEPETYKIT
jgi:hypothetical protein